MKALCDLISVHLVLKPELFLKKYIFWHEKGNERAKGKPFC